MSQAEKDSQVEKECAFVCRQPMVTFCRSY
jgi:hypothetical protein